MLRKIITLILLSLLFIVSLDFTYSDCTYTKGGGNYAWDLDKCLRDTNLVDSWSLEVDWWFKDFILRWVTIISSFFALLAVFALASWAFKFVTSAWEEEKIKKAKDMIKWSLLWFLVIISSSAIITLVIERFYILE